MLLPLLRCNLGRLLGYDCKQNQIILTAVDDAVSGVLGAVVAIPRGQRFFAAIADGTPHPADDVADFAAGWMRVHTDGGSSRQTAAYDFAVFSCKHLGGDITIAAVQTRNHRLLQALKTYLHLQFPIY